MIARRRWAGASLAAALVASMLFLSSRPVPALFACPFRDATGLLCPFCGSTRAAHELLSGNIEGAIALNPLGTLFVPLAVGFVVWVFVVPLLRARPIRTVQAPRWLAWTSAAVIGAVWVLRNVPGAWPLPITA